MKYLRIPLAVLIALMMTSWARTTTSISQASSLQGQTNQATALERGYRTGYSDGFGAGSRDLANHGARDNRTINGILDRGYNEAWGTIEDYRDGYQQGYESGYNAGYEGRPFNSNIPSGLSRRGPTDNGGTANSPDNSTQTDAGQTTNGQVNGSTNIPQIIPRDTILTVELESSLSTDATQRGDRFQARVIEPREFAGATVDGRVTRVKRAGKVKGTSELQLEFETIHMPDGSTSGFKAEVVELVDMGNRDGAGTVDSEGGVKGRSSTKDNIAKIGASTGIGAIIGAVVGGGKGAAIGAAIGGAVGTSSVVTKHGQDVRLDRGQQMKIRTSSETRVQ
ncbi:MAG: hypothetical protein ABJA18_03135 [bacterium]